MTDSRGLPIGAHEVLGVAKEVYQVWRVREGCWGVGMVDFAVI